MPVTLDNDLIRQAYDILESHIHKTPVVRNVLLSKQVGAQVFLKLENLQRGGSYKIRGAMNFISSLARSGFEGELVAASAGNHGQGVALAAQEFDLKARIIMPEGSVQDKINSTRSFGAQVELYGANLKEALAHALAICRDESAQFVHPYEHPLIMAGQGTVGLEIFDQCPDAGTVVIPIGGGGLACGVATALKARNPKIHIVGVQAAAAPSMVKSWRAKKILESSFQPSLADGINVQKPSEAMLEVLERVVDDMVLVDEEAIARAMLFLILRGKVLAEGAGAVSVAALMEGLVDIHSRSVLCVVSGGNVDPHRIVDLMEAQK